MMSLTFLLQLLQSLLEGFPDGVDESNDVGVLVPPPKKMDISIISINTKLYRKLT